MEAAASVKYLTSLAGSRRRGSLAQLARNSRVYSILAGVVSKAAPTLYSSSCLQPSVSFLITPATRVSFPLFPSSSIGFVALICPPCASGYICKGASISRSAINLYETARPKQYPSFSLDSRELSIFYVGSVLSLSLFFVFFLFCFIE